MNLTKIGLIISIIILGILCISAQSSWIIDNLKSDSIMVSIFLLIIFSGTMMPISVKIIKNRTPLIEKFQLIIGTCFFIGLGLITIIAFGKWSSLILLGIIFILSYLLFLEKNKKEEKLTGYKRNKKLDAIRCPICGEINSIINKDDNIDEIKCRKCKRRLRIREH